MMRSRLALQFTLILGVILIIIFSGVYLAFSIYRKINFDNDLKQRAIIAAQSFLAYDNLDRDKFSEIQKKYKEALPGEIIRLYDRSNHAVFIDEGHFFWTAAVLSRIRKQSEYAFSTGNRECYGIYYHDNQGDYVIISSAIDQRGYHRLEFLLILMAASLLLSLLVVYFLGKWFASRALEPMAAVVKQVQNIEASNLHLRVKESERKDEIGDLATTFNDLLERLESSFEMQRSFVSNASHELRTPITAIIGEIEVALNKDRSTAEYKGTLQVVFEESLRLKEIINSLLGLAHAGADFSKRESVRMDDLMWDVKEAVKSTYKDAQIEVQMPDLPEDPSHLILEGYKPLLHIALSNIIGNAVKFSNGKKVVCSLEYVDKKILISVNDNGIGIAGNEIEQIFQPFYRGKNASGYGGYGIGLSMAKKIIALHNGTLSLSSALNKGTRLTLQF